jgi:Tfp pilus assembly pilus retraction ATPase PilT
LRQAHEAGAQTLLILAGQPPVMRIAGQLSPPLVPGPLDWNETRDLAEQLLPTEQRTDFEQTGSADIPFRVGHVSGNLTVFYGNGCHNLIFHLVSGNGKKPA